MIPSVNLLFVNLKNIYFSKSSLEVIKKELTEINFNKKKVSYSFSEINDKINSIELSDLNFSYDGINEIFNETNFKFEKGKIYCLSGVSGSGKSTIINLIMGFLIPNQGVIKYNNKKNILENIKGWQKKISYLSQKVFLLNDTIKKNIAFSHEEHEIDEIKVFNSMEKVNLKDYVENLNDGIETNLGDDGSFLSGGQKQRIGIARNLYFDKEILILDEFTSSLDINNENLIFEEISKIKYEKIIIMISHSENIIKKSDVIIEVKNKSLHEVK